MDFTDRVVIITGASAGIGAQTAVQFAARGAAVVLCGRNVQNLHQTALKCQESGATKENVLEMIGDILQDQHLQDIIDSTIKSFGKINVLVNNAGGPVVSNVQSSTVDCLDDSYKLNTRAPIQLSKLAIPHLLKTRGNIVNMSTVLSMRPWSLLKEYVISKSALDAFTTVSALELAPSGVRVNSVNAGPIATDLCFTRGMVDSKDKLGDYRKLLATMIPMGRVGTVQEVADAVLFFASDMASFITGVTLPVDGGHSVTSWRPRPAAPGEDGHVQE